MSTPTLNTRTRKILDRAARLKEEQEAAVQEELEMTFQDLESFLHHMEQEEKELRNGPSTATL